MITISAILRTPKGTEGDMRKSLLDIIQDVKDNEPETLSYFISEDYEDPCIFTTYERFANKAAMDKHNNSKLVGELYVFVKSVGAEVTLIKAEEIAVKL